MFSKIAKKSANENQRSQKSGTENVDPAEYIFCTPELHDRHIVVQDPGTGKTERIGIASSHLMAHSIPFREMLSGSRLADLKSAEIVITGVSPATFKLMLRYLYGGKLPILSPTEALALARCAAKYRVKPLLIIAYEMLIPTSARDVFPALVDMTFLTCPRRVSTITKIVQEQTNELVQDKNFLQLNMKSLLFIVKQEKLNVTEVELWKNIVRWGNNKLQLQPQNTLREILIDVLEHIRFLTFSLEEIANDVLPTRILTPEECMDLILAKTKNSPLAQPALCTISEKRILHGQICETDGSPKTLQNPSRFNVPLIFLSFGNFQLSEKASTTHSNITILPIQTVQLEKFICKTRKMEANNTCFCCCYKLHCIVHVDEFKEGNLLSGEDIVISITAPLNSEVALQLQRKNSEPLVLKADHLYKIGLKFQSPHPSFSFYTEADEYVHVDQTRIERFEACMRVKFEDYPHVLQMVYKV